MISLLPSLNPVPSLYRLLACLTLSQAFRSFGAFAIPASRYLRLLAHTGKKWPQGLHRSTEYLLISTGTEHFSCLLVSNPRT
jgi:hypothetical protein